MTLRTRTLGQEAKFSLVFFDVDRTFSIVEMRKLQVVTPEASRVIGARVQVKIGKEIFEAKIRDQSNDKNVFEEKLNEVEEADSINSVSDTTDTVNNLPQLAAKPKKQDQKGKKSENKIRNQKEGSKFVLRLMYDI